MIMHEASNGDHQIRLVSGPCLDVCSVIRSSETIGKLLRLARERTLPEDPDLRGRDNKRRTRMEQATREYVEEFAHRDAAMFRDGPEALKVRFARWTREAKVSICNRIASAS
jgi:hypothetical protein